MTENEILPFIQQGGWTVPHEFYFPQSKRLLQQAKDLAAQLDNKENEIRQQVTAEEKDWDENTIGGYIHHLMNDEWKQLDTICITTQIFSCMAVEAFLNYYGVKRLGEKYYKRSLERLGISQKLETLIAICNQKLIDDKSKIATTVRRMFDRRNSLAHPKSRELFNEKGEFVLTGIINHLEQAEQAVNDMVAFFDLFQEIDNDTSIGNPNNRNGETIKAG